MLETMSIPPITPIALHAAMTCLGQLSRTVAVWHRRVRTRAHLRQLDEERLRDIGVHEVERRRECAKWFWQH